MTWLLHQLPSFCVSIVSLVAFVAVGDKRRIGWLIGILSEVVWAAWAIAIHQYGLLFMCGAFAWLYWRNFRKWS